MEDLFQPFEEPPQDRTVRRGKWPHQCSNCGRFVKHDTLRSGMHGDEYWATADCGNCERRWNANPI